IRGEVRAVPAAAQASVLVLPVAIDSGEEWLVLDADQLEIEPVQSVDPLRPLAHVRANAVEVGDDRVLSNLSRTLARALMSTLLSAESIGVARWATDNASAYAKIREQFGRPIGQFQAIKHKCAEMIADTERATAAVWDAARAIDEYRETGSEETAFEFAAAVAATLAPAAARHCTQDCSQVHGGIGSTWEHDTNVYYRRAIMLAACFGRAGDYPQQVVDVATSTGLRKIDIGLDPETEKLRQEIRAEVAALKAIPGAQPGHGHRSVADTVGRRIRHGGAEAAVPAADVPRRDDLVPADFRAGFGFGLGEPHHQGHQGRWWLAYHRPEDLDHRRTGVAVGHAAGPHGPERTETQRHH